MKSIHPQKSKTPIEAASHAKPRRSLRHHWPLLLYPATILAAMIALHLAHRSIERELPPLRDGVKHRVSMSGRAGQSTSTTAGLPDIPAASTAESMMPGEESATTVDAGTGLSSARQDEAANGTGQAASAVGEISAVDTDQLQGPDKIVTLLRLAVENRDHNRIKQYLDELAALGDAAVVGLNDLVNVGGEAGLWAAEALARIGTPMATTALLDTLAQTKEGSFKEELGRRIAGINNHDSWPILLDTMTQTADAAVARAASTSLARMADTPVMDEIIARYEAAATEAEMQRLAQLVRNIQSPKATDALLSLAGDIASAPQDALQQAAIDAIANVGDAQCLSHLLRRLEATTPGEGTDIYNAIARVSNPDVHSQLLYAAAGNKEVSAEYGRTAALEALKNYPSEETIALLERIIAQESNEKVVTAASRTLDDIRRAPHVITAKADTLKKSEEMLPLKPLTK